jgi:hypothetical protein
MPTSDTGAMEMLNKMIEEAQVELDLKLVECKAFYRSFRKTLKDARNLV